jgi:hypothetical protein
MGRLIPAGTGVPKYTAIEVNVEEPPAEEGREPVPVVSEAVEAR